MRSDLVPQLLQRLKGLLKKKRPMPLLWALLAFLVLAGLAWTSVAGCGKLFTNGDDEVDYAQPLFDSTLYAHSTDRQLSEFLYPEMPDTIPPIAFEPNMLKAMFEQAKYLRRPDLKKVPVKGISKEEMLEAVDRLQAMQLLDPHAMLSSFDFYRVKTGLKDDKIRLTGYYTPIIKASRKREGPYQYPLYRKPESNIPSPAAIESGALAGRGLELAWVAKRRQVRDAQLQGSCLLEFPDGKRQFFGFGGSVRGAGGNYVFFVEVDEVVIGAGYFPVTAGYTIAVDTRYIPLGAMLFAELPDIDPSGKQIGTTYRVLFAQDRGGGIKTTKRIDLYSGIGQKGLESARRINRYARMWLMLPKQKNSAPDS